MSNLTEDELYWLHSWSEVLFNNGIDICTESEEQNEAIAKDFAANASVQSEYMAPVEGDSEVEKLKLQIKKLESRVPCTYCGGHGGAWTAVGSSHKGWDDCRYCHGNKWLSS